MKDDKYEVSFTYETKDGFVTSPSPVVYMWDSTEPEAIMHIPLGPPNVVARIVRIEGPK